MGTFLVALSTLPAIIISAIIISSPLIQKFQLLSNMKSAALISSAKIFKPTLFFSSLKSHHSHFFLPPIRSLSRRILIRSGRNLSISAVGAHTTNASASSSTMASQSQSFLRSVLSNMEKVYLNKNPTAKSVLELFSSYSESSPICYDHFAFRTFGIDGHGIDSIAKLFLDFGYTQRDELIFPAKKLRAFWFSPPEIEYENNGSFSNTPLPRIFISELLVDQLSSQSQEIIKKYVRTSGNGSKYAALASSLGNLTWEKPIFSDFQELSKESEYAAWTLVNGYAVNHVTISVHRLKSRIRDIKSLNEFIEDQGFKLNSEGGVLKVSPDGLLLQSSTVADSIMFDFADGITESVPCSYIEFAERLILPQFKKLAAEEIKEYHRRDGFEVGNADKIFESTSKDQLTRKTA